MRRCVECGAALPVPEILLVPYLTSLGLNLKVEANVYTCEVCGDVVEGFTQVVALHQAITDHITARPGALSGAEIRFLRKHIGLSSKDLAEQMGVDPATVSRWQAEKQKMSASHDRMLRLLARLGPLIERYQPQPREEWEANIALRHEHGEWTVRAAVA